MKKKQKRNIDWQRLISSTKAFIKKWKKHPDFIAISRVSAFIIATIIFTLFLRSLYSKNEISLKNKEKENKFQRILFSDWDLQAKTIEGELELKLGTDKDKNKIAVSRDNKSIEFSTPLEKIDTDYDKQKARFIDQENNLEINYQLIDSGIKEEIILKQKPESNQFFSDFKIKNLQAFYENKQIIFEDQSGNYQFHITRPYVYDAAGNVSYAVNYELREIDAKEIIKNSFEGKVVKKEFLSEKELINLDNKNYQLITTVDNDWLFSEDRVYPITIDPTIIHDTQAEFAAGSYSNTYWNSTDNAIELSTYGSENDTNTIGLWTFDNDDVGVSLNNTGGTITTDGDYKIHTFTGNGTFTVTNDTEVEYLIVAGGGSGGTDVAGGGGAGGVIHQTAQTLTAGTYSVVVGAGGAAGSTTYTDRGNNGGNSSFNGETAIGGGREAAVGGSGGGGGDGITAGGAGTAGQGNNGGNGISGASSTYWVGGGGGGKGGAGVAASTSKGGNGGAGYTSTISGSSYIYAAGGGGGYLKSNGGASLSNRGLGGSGVGGNGGVSSGSTAIVAASAPTTYGSGGGGGAWQVGNNQLGTAGYQGVVIIRYLDSTKATTDSSNQGNDAAINGNVSETPGQVKNAKYFDGDGDYLEVSSTAYDFTSEDFTIDFWMNTSNPNKASILLGNYTYASKGYDVVLSGESDGALTFRTHQSGTVQFTKSLTETIEANKWQHVSIVRNGSNATIYVDGRDVTATHGTHINPASSSNNMIIGSYQGTDWYYTGSIDEVRISNIARSAEEIKQSYENSLRKYDTYYQSEVIDLGSPGILGEFSWSELTSKNTDPETPYDNTGLIAQWKFNETSGTTATSEGYCGASCDGTLTNFSDTTAQDVALGSGWTSDNKIWGAGSLRFDGVDDYVNVTSVPLSTGDTAHSISVWVKPDGTPTTRQWPLLLGNAGTGAHHWTYNSDGLFHIGVWSGAQCTVSPNVGEWNYIVATYDGAGTLKCYKNGIEESHTESATFDLQGVKFSMGMGQGSEAYFDGTLDNISLYSRALSSSEILANYYSTNTQFQYRYSNDGNTWSSWQGETSSSLLSYSPWQEILSSATTEKLTSTATDISGKSNLEVKLACNQLGQNVQMSYGESDYSIYEADANTVGLWKFDEEAPTPIDATGGLISYDGDYKIHTFTSSGTFTIDSPAFVEVLVVGGGGGGGGTGSGGGAGGYLYNESFYINSGNHSVTVGAGGNGGVSTSIGGDGGNSIFSTLTAIGGGGGVSHFATSGRNGGSGSGAAVRIEAPTSVPGEGTPGQGNRGGNGYVQSSWQGTNGGGGGAGAVGANAGNYSGAGNGGAGIANSISGTSKYYAGGGGGGEVIGSYVGSGGSGIGGRGVLNSHGTDATIYTGSGGGGGSYNAGYYNGGNGSGGIVIISYPEEGNVIDSSSQENNAFSYNDTKTVPGQLGNAKYFDGNGDYLEVSSGFNQITDLTVSFWFKTASTNRSSLLGQSSSSPTNSPSSYVPTIMLNTDGTIRAEYWTGAVGDITTTSSYNDNKWHYLSFSGSSTNQSLYIDGELIGERSGTINNSWWTTTTIGTGYDSSTRGATTNAWIYFDGSIDEVRISNIARSAEEIKQSYEIGVRSHTFTTQFKANLQSNNLIADNTDLSFDISETAYNTNNEIENLYPGDSIIIKETVSSTDYMAEAKVLSADELTGLVIVDDWTATSTFPAGGFTTNAEIFKWENQYLNLNQVRDESINATSRFLFRDLNSNASCYLKTIKASSYITDPIADLGIIGAQYFQYKTILSSFDPFVSPELTAVSLSYIAGAGTPIFGQNSISDDIKTNDVTPTILFEATSGDASDLNYEVQWSTESSFASYSSASSSTDAGFINTENGLDTDPFTPENIISYTWQSNLSNNTTYFYRVRASNTSATGSWSEVRALTTDTSLANNANRWYQNKTQQFEGNTNDTGITISADAVTVNSGTATMTSPKISASSLNAAASHWYQLNFSDTETNGDIKYQILYDDASTPTMIPDSILTGNETGFDTAPISLRTLDTTSYPDLYIKAILTYETASPSLNNWELSLNNKAEISTQTELTGYRSTTPTFQLYSTDTDNDYLQYKITLCTDSAMTTNCQTFDQTQDQTGWSGQNANSSTAYSSGSLASYTVQTTLQEGTDYYWKSEALDLDGSQYWSGTQAVASFFTTSTTPLSPDSLWVEGESNPTDVKDLTPDFSAIYRDTDSSDYATAYQIQVSTSPSFTSINMWDSGKIGMPNLATDTRMTDVTYAGNALLFDGTTYYWRIRFWDSADQISPWSSGENYFTMYALSAPYNCLLTRDPQNNNITIFWEDANPIKDSFTIQKSTNLGTFINLATGINSSSTQYLDTNILTGNSYRYRVATLSEGVLSPYCYTDLLNIGLGDMMFEGLNLSGISID
jgi:hypothetical protein